MAKVVVLFLILFVMVAAVSAGEKPKEGYKDLELPKFDRLNTKPSPSRVSIDASCISRDGRQIHQGDPAYAACLSDLRHGPNPQAIPPVDGASGPNINLNYNTHP